MASIAGHKSDCMCSACLWADMNEFTGRVETIVEMAPERTRYATPGANAGRGVVRLVSVAQVKFIKRLMIERDTTNLVRLPGSEDIEHMSLRGATDLIERLLACPMKPTLGPAGAVAPRPASEKQLAFIKTLSARKGMTDLSADATAENASKIIDGLLALDDKPTPAASTAAPALSEGLYRRADGGIVLAKESKAGRLYGKLYNPTTKSFEYAPGTLSGSLTRLTLDEAKDLSVEMGECARCGRTLTATVDGVAPRDRIIGPICAQKMGY